MGIENNSLELNPNKYVLFQNHPNPFNPNTITKYQIPELSFVILKVFDLMGNEIATLVEEEKPVGVYEVEFKTANLPSMIYFYRLEAIPADKKTVSFVDTKKMVLVK